MSERRQALGLFEAVGVEIELMIVDAESLDVRPIADELIRAACGAYESEIERGEIAWSNELVLHQIELKTNGPRTTWTGLGAAFQREIDAIGAILREHQARLLPTAMHPWMQPAREALRWPHEYNEVYRSFDTIFDCRSHGWANVQSIHVNLPFADDAEFGRLHAATRFVLPLLPALAASSPIRDGVVQRSLDARLVAYRDHTAEVPELTGSVIPEPVFTRRAYEQLLQSLYAAIAPHDAAGTLQHEWLNARGAIARFDRGAIEIRLLDTQEHVGADVAVARAVSAAVACLCDEDATDQTRLRTWPTERLVRILDATIRDADTAWIDDVDYLDALGLGAPRPRYAREVWQQLWQRLRPRVSEDRTLIEPIEFILDRGTLARRIRTAVGAAPSRARLRETYGAIADCLDAGRMFDGAPR